MKMLLTVAVLLAASPATALAQFDETQVRRDCRTDALRYCAGFIPAAVRLRLRDPTDGERGAVVSCMLANRDKLQSKCSRHLY